MRNCVYLVVLMSVLASTSHLRAGVGCESWASAPSMNFLEGVNGVVYAMMPWDHDGFASTPPLVVVGGQFTHAGGIPANNIAAWDGQTWRAFGNSPGGGLTHSSGNGAVRALTVFNNELIAGGWFDTQDGTTTFSKNVARWNGFQWQTFGFGVQKTVYAMVVFNGQLSVGGAVDDGGTPDLQWDDMATMTWTGLVWTHQYSDFGIDGPIRAYAVLNNQLYAGGDFTWISSTPCPGFARWNGSVWEPVNGVAGSVRTLVHDPDTNWLFVGGQFIGTVGQTHVNTAFYGAGGWYPAGGGFDGVGTDIVRAATYTGNPGQSIVAVGNRDGSESAMAWNGSSWIPYIATFNNPLYATCHVDPSELVANDESTYFGGSFTSVDTQDGTVSTTRVAARNHLDDFVPLYQAPPIRAMHNAAVGFVVAGDFVHSLPNGQVAHYVARWNGSQLQTLATFPGEGEGTNGPVYALRSQNVGPFTRNLYLGGAFTAAGGFNGVFANRIVRYTTSTIEPAASFNPMGAGFNNAVYAIEIHNNQVYAAGAFTSSGGTPLNYIARWDSGVGAWQPVGAGFNGVVRCLQSHNGDLYAGGFFTSSGGNIMPRIARWNGSTWNAVPVQGMNNAVLTLTVHNGELIAGGRFTTAGGIAAKGVAKWNGTAWSQIGNGLDPLTDGAVESLTVSPGNTLVAAGKFLAGPFLNSVAYFDGSIWLSAQFKGNGRVNVALYRGSELHVGGEFQYMTTSAAPILSPTWARLLDFTQPVFSQQPTSPPPACAGGIVQLTCTLHADYPNFQFQWQRDGIDLVNGNTVAGSTISGATSTTLTIQNFAPGDAGSYACAVSYSGCAESLSSTAQVSLDPQCSCPADITGDTTVNVSDLLAVISSWGACADPNNCPADVNGDDLVNVADLLLVISAWGPCA